MLTFGVVGLILRPHEIECLSLWNHVSCHFGRLHQMPLGRFRIFPIETVWQ